MEKLLSCPIPSPTQFNSATSKTFKNYLQHRSGIIESYSNQNNFTNSILPRLPPPLLLHPMQNCSNEYSEKSFSILENSSERNCPYSLRNKNRKRQSFLKDEIESIENQNEVEDHSLCLKESHYQADLLSHSILLSSSRINNRKDCNSFELNDYSVIENNIETNVSTRHQQEDHKNSFNITYKGGTEITV